MKAASMTTPPPQNDMLSDEYRRQLYQKHTTDALWGITGVLHYDTILDLIDRFHAKTVLDYGCGKGFVGKKFRAQQALPGSKYADVVFYEYDPGIEGKDDTSTTADILVCIDVLEHIEPAFLDKVLTDMERRTKMAAFLVIDCVPAEHTLPDGRNAHLIIESPEWWAERLAKYYHVSVTQSHSGRLFAIVKSRTFDMEAADRASVAAAEPAEKKSSKEEDKIVQKAETLTASGKYSRARALLLKVKNQKEAPEVLFALGNIYYKTNDMLKAAGYFLEYAQLKNAPKGYCMAGIALSKVENYEAALKCLELNACKTTFMDDADYREALMLSWTKIRKPEEAVALYESRSDNTLLHTVHYIDALILLQKLEKARDVAEQATKDFPDRPEGWSALERAYTALRQFEKALPPSLKAVELDPESAVYQCNLGLVYLCLARIEDSLACFNRATEMDRLMMAPYLNRSTIHRYKKDFAHLADDLDKAYQLDPASADVHYAIGVCALKREKYEKAFAELEWFWQTNKISSFRMPAAAQRWYGEDISQKTVMFYADQGIGDIIMMMRYIPDLVKKYNPKKLVINVNKKMEALFTASFPELFSAGPLEFYGVAVSASDAAIDCIVAATTLPHSMGTRIDTVPHAASYLKKQNTVDYKTGTGKDFVIGISWYTKSLDAGYIRSLKLSDFSFLAKYDNIRVIDLQYGDTSAERAENAANGFHIYHDDSVDSWNAMQPFMDQVAACDLIISIDNTTVHAAGAMGVPCWTILAQEPYWRWPVSGDATPWYESLRLFRQKSKAYTELFVEIETEFKKFLGGDRSVLVPPKFKPIYPPEPVPAKRALLINDTGSAYSWGNWAGMQGIRQDLIKQGYAVEGIPTLELNWFAERVPALQDFDNPKFLSSCRYRDPTLFAAMEHADDVIINGEGMMSGANELAIKMLYLAYVAKHFYGRRVSIINHSCYPEDQPTLSDPQKLAFYHKVYSKIDACVVRDQISYDLISSIGLNVTLGLDTSILWIKDYLANHKDTVKTKTAVLTVGPGYDSRFANLFASLYKTLQQNGVKPLLLKGAEWHISHEDHMLEQDLKELTGGEINTITAHNAEEFANYLASARMVISGFHQICLMAYAMGTPVIPLTTGTNALSFLGLSKMCDISAPIFYDDPAAEKKLIETMKNIMKASPPKSGEKTQLLETLASLALKNTAVFKG